MVQMCYLCKNGEIVVDKKMSSSYCTGCGECFDLGAFTDELQYREDDKGRYTSVGTAFHLEKGFVNCKFSSHTQFLASVDNAKSILKRYCEKLSISESYAQISSGFYKQLLLRKYMNGRRLNVVLAACLYIAVRTEGVQVILLDISDVAEANVYDIGRYYFQICHLLQQNIYTVDPSEYTLRFVEMLNLGDRSNAQVKYTEAKIRETANRLVQRMKRDWIHYGRRPSGVCAAAVLVAARINNVNCRIKDIISIAKVCESTIRKRLSEFVDTAASKLTYTEFMSNETDADSSLQEEDPPAFKNGTKEISEANVQEVEEFHKIIVEQLKESRPKVKGMYASFLKAILAEKKSETPTPKEGEEELSSEEADKQSISEVVVDENVSVIDEKIPQDLDVFDLDGNDDPLDFDQNYWANLRPTAQTLGLTRKERRDDKQPNDYQELLQLDLTEGMDDDEIDSYIIKDNREISFRDLQWNQLNKDFILKEKEKQLLKIEKEKEKSEKPPEETKPRKKRRKTDNQAVEAATASEAVEALCVQKNQTLNGINLKRLFNEDETHNTHKLLVQNEFISEDIGEQEEVEKSLDQRMEDAELVSMYHSYAQPESP